MTDDPVAAAVKYPPLPPDREHSGKPKRHLSRKKQATERPIGDGAVNAIYPEAIEVAGLLSSAGVRGMGVFMGLFAIMATSFGSYMGFLALTDGRGGEWFSVLFILFGVVALGVAVTFFRLDLFNYRDEPILFNRKTRKVHIFRRRVQMRKPWRRWPLVIDSYDWEQITGEIRGGFQLVGGSLPALRYRLVAAVSDGPTGPGHKTKVVDEIILGMEETFQDDCVARWEHIRRYMEEGGPPLQAGERLALTRGFSHRLAFARGGLWVLLPDFYKDFRTKPVGLILSTLVQVLLSPMLIIFAFFRWLAEITSRSPWWPANILEAAGGAPLLEAEVHAQADALKRAGEAIEEAKLTDEERQERAYIKAKEAEPFWTPERKKYALALLAICAVLGIGKLAQVWLRGY